MLHSECTSQRRAALLNSNRQYLRTGNRIIERLARGLIHRRLTQYHHFLRPAHAVHYIHNREWERGITLSPTIASGSPSSRDTYTRLLTCCLFSKAMVEGRSSFRPSSGAPWRMRSRVSPSLTRMRSGPLDVDVGM